MRISIWKARLKNAKTPPASLSALTRNPAPRSARLLTFGTPSHSVLAHMNVIRFTDPQFAAQVRRLTSASSLFDKTIEERTRAIVEAVHAPRESALGGTPPSL